VRETQSLERQAERLKGFFIASCEEVDLEVGGAEARQLDCTWLVACFAAIPGVETSDPSVVLVAALTQDCHWPRKIHVWSAHRKDSGVRIFLHGRESVSPGQLTAELMQTRHELQVVQSAVEAGIASPYWFQTSVWCE